MQLLILLLLYAAVCANFCSRQGTTAPAQSGSIKALRATNIRRDGVEALAQIAQRGLFKARLDRALSNLV
ncbi:hypothetical protein WISP_94977 [Willisornis vidua]|uniref:Uncharacterized protein n=1 Tax=Willisornis vidua TaxID=1566151 RepID=A0ABQ9D633_9PASS|nr:hypothetical protein WISP_94977 [Willisornis vidua]